MSFRQLRARLRDRLAEVSPETHVAILNQADRDGIDVTFSARGRIAMREIIDVLVRIGRRIIRAIIPIGFECDATSMPRLAWSILGHPFAAHSLLAAIVHDFLCRTKRYADALVHRVFYVMLREKIDRTQKRWRVWLAELRAALMYRAVVSFGPSWTVLPSLRIATAEVTP